MATVLLSNSDQGWAWWRAVEEGKLILNWVSRPHWWGDQWLTPAWGEGQREHSTQREEQNKAFGVGMLAALWEATVTEQREPKAGVQKRVVRVRDPQAGCGRRLFPERDGSLGSPTREAHLTDISVRSLGYSVGSWLRRARGATQRRIVRDCCNNKGTRGVGPCGKGRQSSWRQIGCDVDKFIYIV